ncbi:unnamed protein product [Amaranthus hypochondriacus]
MLPCGGCGLCVTSLPVSPLNDRVPAYAGFNVISVCNAQRHWSPENLTTSLNYPEGYTLVFVLFLTSCSGEAPSYPKFDDSEYFRNCF